MSRLLTKESRIAHRNAATSRLLEKGWKQETYKGVDFFTWEDGGKYHLKCWWGNSAHELFWYTYSSNERRQARIDETKETWDIHEARKQKEKENPRKSGAAACAAAIRAELKELFPGVKFSVRSDNFAGGDSVVVSWEDGPTTREVDSIIGKYQYGHFDGMTDMYESSNRRDDIPQSRYVKSGREQSDNTKLLVPKLESIFFKKDSDAYYDKPEQVFYRLFQKTSFPPGGKAIDIVRTDITCGQYEDFFKIVFDTPEVEKSDSLNVEKVEIEPGEIKIIEYGKGIAVIGDTKPIREQLGKNGLKGIFQPRLSCGPGWIFPKNRLEEVETLLQSLATA